MKPFSETFTVEKRHKAVSRRLNEAFDTAVRYDVLELVLKDLDQLKTDCVHLINAKRGF